ncbi:hypothetical protein AAF712_013014 [Marasmius tenuissimus]|uniref:F-box domain-containing protein n=1 Tax=Marasmius tenuissimus TaxID=585030 RepID=A0ABR2ZEZ1_9AGAR|nr:hypothetical protein PM082_001916 [Marasmius tenuissimus]
MDRIMSFMGPKSLHSAVLVSKKWYSSAFIWAYRNILVPDERALRSLSEFWDYVGAFQPNDVDLSAKHKWKVLAVGRNRMLATPRTVTFGQHTPKHSFHKDRTTSTTEVPLGTVVDSIFQLLDTFTHVASLTFQVMPGLKLRELLPLLSRRLPYLTSLTLDSTFLSTPAPRHLCPHLVFDPLLPESLRSLSLLGMRSSSLSVAEWELLMLFAECPSIRVLEIDDTTWIPFYKCWASRSRLGGLRSLDWHCDKDAVPAAVFGAISLDTFQLLPDSGNTPPPARGKRVGLRQLGEYLKECSTTLRSLHIRSFTEVADEVDAGLAWKPFDNLVEFAGSAQQFHHLHSDNKTWHRLTFTGRDGFSVINCRNFIGLRCLILTLDEDLELPFVLSRCPDLHDLQVTLLKGNVTALLTPNSLTSISIGFSSLIRVQISFWRQVGVGQAHGIFDAWRAALPSSMKTVRFMHVEDDFSVVWKRVVSVSDRRWVELITEL